MDDASAPSATGECADALQACDKGTQISTRAVATALSAVIKERLERIKRLTEAAPKIYFNLALFVCAVVIKCANEDIGDRDHENISAQYHQCSRSYAQHSLRFRSADVLTHTPIQHRRPDIILTTPRIIIRTIRGTVTTAARTITEIDSRLTFLSP